MGTYLSAIFFQFFRQYFWNGARALFFDRCRRGSSIRQYWWSLCADLSSSAGHRVPAAESNLPYAPARLPSSEPLARYLAEASHSTATLVLGLSHLVCRLVTQRKNSSFYSRLNRHPGQILLDATDLSDKTRLDHGMPSAPMASAFSACFKRSCSEGNLGWH